MNGMQPQVSIEHEARGCEFDVLPVHLVYAIFITGCNLEYLL